MGCQTGADDLRRYFLCPILGKVLQEVLEMDLLPLEVLVRWGYTSTSVKGLLVPALAYAIFNQVKPLTELGGSLPLGRLLEIGRAARETLLRARSGCRRLGPAELLTYCESG